VLVKTEFQPTEKAVINALEDYFQKQISVSRAQAELDARAEAETRAVDAKK
jgi:hypothetical protein